MMAQTGVPGHRTAHSALSSRGTPTLLAFEGCRCIAVESEAKGLRQASASCGPPHLFTVGSASTSTPATGEGRLKSTASASRG